MCNHTHHGYKPQIYLLSYKSINKTRSESTAKLEKAKLAKIGKQIFATTTVNALSKYDSARNLCGYFHPAAAASVRTGPSSLKPQSTGGEKLCNRSQRNSHFCEFSLRTGWHTGHDFGIV